MSLGSSALGDGKLVGLVLTTVHDRTALVIITDCLMRSYILDSSGTVLLKVINLFFTMTDRIDEICM